MAKKGRPTNTKRMIKSLTPKADIASMGDEPLIIPNHSGEHDAGTTGTPTADNKIANKKYVDDEIASIDLGGLVPYTGATDNVDLGDNKLTIKDIYAGDEQELAISAGDNDNLGGDGGDIEITAGSSTHFISGAGGDVIISAGTSTMNNGDVEITGEQIIITGNTFVEGVLGVDNLNVAEKLNTPMLSVSDSYGSPVSIPHYFWWQHKDGSGVMELREQGLNSELNGGDLLTEINIAGDWDFGSGDLITEGDVYAGSLYGKAGWGEFEAFDLVNSIMYDAIGNKVFEFGYNLGFYDRGSDLSIEWDERGLYAYGGTTKVIDYSSSSQVRIPVDLDVEGEIEATGDITGNNFTTGDIIPVWGWSKDLGAPNAPFMNTYTYQLFLSGNLYLNPFAQVTFGSGGVIFGMGDELFIDPDEAIHLGGVGINYTEIKPNGEINLHGTARVIKELDFNAGSIKVPGADAATWVSHGIIGAWEFSNNKEDTIVTAMNFPKDMDLSVAPTIKVNWGSGATEENAVWQIEYLYRQFGEDTTANAQDTLTQTTTSSATANGFTTTEFTGFDIPHADDRTVFVRVTRLGSDGNDTLGDTAELHSLIFKYTSNKLGEPT